MGKMHAEGVTLIEAMVTTAVVAIALAIGVPAMRDITATNQMSAAVNDIVTSVHLARAEAVKRSQPTALCATSEWNDQAADCEATTLRDGWIVFIDDNPGGPNGVRDAGETVVLSHGPLDGRVDVAGPPLLRFDGLGVPAIPTGTIVTYRLCDERGNRVIGNRTTGRLIEINPTGRPRIIASPGDVVCPE